MNEISAIKPPGSHPLQAPERNWPLANCYMDLWIGLLDYWRLDPTPALGVTLAMDFEGDQFTFFKFPHDELEKMYGVIVHEVSCYDTLERHTIEQLKRGRVVLAEVDGWYLPDTRATSYHMVHVKTTVGAVDIDPLAKRLTYFHANGCWDLEGDDYDGVFRRAARFAPQEDILPPFVELAYRRFKPLEGDALTDAARQSLRHHLGRRPDANPFERYAEVFPDHAARLQREDEQFYHVYAFHVTRQIGSNYELMGSFLRWLERRGSDFGPTAELCDKMSASAKALQFQLARINAGRKSGRALETVMGMARTHDEIMTSLASRCE
jgi:hypothetical protein